MDQNIFWDKGLSSGEIAKIFADEEHPRWVEWTALLLSRTSDIRMVFAKYVSKETFCRRWRSIKAEMKKNKWSGVKTDFWDQTHKVIYAQLGRQVALEKKRRVEPASDVLQFSEILRVERKRQGLTQGRLAQVCGLSQQTVSNVENGKSDYSMSAFKKIAEALKLRVSVTAPDSPALTTSTFNDR